MEKPPDFLINLLQLFSVTGTVSFEQAIHPNKTFLPACPTLQGRSIAILLMYLLLWQKNMMTAFTSLQPMRLTIAMENTL